MPRTPARAAVIAATALTLSGCGFFGGDSGNTGGTPTSMRTPGTILSANSTKQLGTTVVDGAVNTLYRFDADSPEPPTSTCLDACAEAWPPVLADLERPPVLEGIEEDAVGTVTRPDGAVQLTIGGWPIYRHAGDSAPGATDGNGVDGTWFAIKPDGSKAARPDAGN